MKQNKPAAKKAWYQGTAPYWALCCIVLGYFLYAQLSTTIRYNVSIGSLAVSGLTREQALQKIQTQLKNQNIGDVSLVIENKPYTIPASHIDLQYNAKAAADRAWHVGRKPSLISAMYDLLILPLIPQKIPLHYSFDSAKLRAEIAIIAETVDEPGKDTRLFIASDSVQILKDTKIGYVLDQKKAYTEVVNAVANGQSATPSIDLQVVKPTVQPEKAVSAQQQAIRVIAQPLTLRYDFRSFRLETATLGAWIKSVPDDTRLRIAFDEQQISQYVTTVAKELDAETKSPRVTVVNNKVTEFTAPNTGRTLDQTETVQDIINALSKRRDGDTNITELALPVSVEKPLITDQSVTDLGIIELIGSASTRLTGSPPNRISNIKNGVKFLTGILIKPGEEFSTLKTLGKIDNSTGYLPELVIKENATVPEYGGGLCQVSTTLFRAVLNTGLPITARQNHSYRVIYYEKDGDGKLIGPGLDATIYNPAPDFRFLNDTGKTILIQGKVVGDKITFDFYGTKDGRTSIVDGPHKLTETPSGKPIYVETDTLKPGVTKRVETAHPGGTAIATYIVTYPDATVKTQVFKSFYRNWPARFLVGIDPTKATSTTPLTEVSPVTN